MRGGIILYDGVCGVCNRFVGFVYPRDPAGRFHFAPIQGGAARAILARHGRDATALDTMYVVVEPGSPSERLLERSDGVLHVLRGLGPGWRLAAAALALVPRPLRDPVYRLVARNRYRPFGRHDTCVLPAPEHRARFIEG